MALALRALSLAPGDRQNALHASELLLRTGRLDEARRNHRRLARHLAEGRGRVSPAVRSADAARPDRGCARRDRPGARGRPGNSAEYHLHRANLLYRLGRLDEAAEAFGRAAALDPANPDAKRSQLTVYFDSGRFTEALAVGGELIRAAPENEEYAQAVLQVLNRRFETLDGDYRRARRARIRPQREPRPPPGFFERLRTQGRVIHALDHPRDPHALRRLEARVRLGIARTDCAHPDAVARIRSDDARSAADRRRFLHLLLYRDHSLSHVCPHQQQHDLRDCEQWLVVAIATGRHIRRADGARSARTADRYARGGHPAGGLRRARARRAAAGFCRGFDLTPGGVAVRLRVRLPQCRDQCIRQVVGQDLGSVDPPFVLLFGNFLCARQ